MKRKIGGSLNSEVNDFFCEGQLYESDEVSDSSNGDRLMFRSDNGLCFSVQPAVSCLLVPYPGDRVIGRRVGSRVFILHILERDSDHSDEAELAVPGCTKLSIVQSEIITRSLELSHETKKYEIEAESTFIRSGKISFLAGTINIISQIMKRIVDRNTSISRSSVDVVKEMECRSSGVLSQDVTSIYSLKSCTTILDSRADTRINGERITMG